MSQQRFESLLGEIATAIAGKPLDDELAAYLNENWSRDGEAFGELQSLVIEGERDGWLLSREAGGIHYGRAVKPGGATGGFSVDVVRMKDVRGPHHLHPKGEIGAVMPIEGAARFDDFDDGWYVYGPGSAHHPTVSGGDAYVLYLLPDGAIQFTGS